MQTLSLFSVGLVTLATIAHSSKPVVPENAAEFRIAVIDYASIINELNGVHVYSPSGNDIDLSSVSEAQMIAIWNTVDEVDHAILNLCQKHKISLVLQSPRWESVSCRRRGVTKKQVENRLSRQLNRPVVYESKIDITAMILATVKKNRE